ncbi:MAG TPA: hypothetical protein VN660_07640 [Steroidobacteraceae bacterium]|nr:hypothetical protein [Steroidobacteraceae bacterium]
MTSAILDHLWQSTLILCLAGLLTLLLRRNSAAARYWLWFAASVKFLVPLWLLSAVATRWISLIPSPALSAPALELGQRLSAPFIPPVSAGALVAASPVLPLAHVSTVLLILWSLGCATVLLSWFIRLRRIQRAVCSAKPLWLDAPIPVRESSSSMQPGLVGI